MLKIKIIPYFNGMRSSLFDIYAICSLFEF